MAGSVIELLRKGSCENRLKPVWYLHYIYIFFLYPNAPLLMWRPPISNAACNKQASLGWSGGLGWCKNKKPYLYASLVFLMQKRCHARIWCYTRICHVHEHVFHKLIPFSVCSFPFFRVYWIVAVSCPACYLCPCMYILLPVFLLYSFPFSSCPRTWFIFILISTLDIFSLLVAGHWSRLDLHGLGSQSKQSKIER